MTLSRTELDTLARFCVTEADLTPTTTAAAALAADTESESTMSMKPEPNPDRIVWIDAEMTGLNPRTDDLLEIAVVITDQDLNELAASSTVIHQFQRAKAIARMEPEVLRMHATSGLLEELAATTEATAMPRVHQAVLELVAEHGALGAVVGGSNPGFDRSFLDHWMRELNQSALHYRSIDVSTIKELARVHAPEVLETAPAKSYQHRALPDIRESIAELRYYLDAGLMTAASTTKGTN